MRLVPVITLLSTILLAGFASAKSPSCDAKFLGRKTAVCDAEQAQDPIAFRRFADGTAIPNPALLREISRGGVSPATHSRIGLLDDLLKPSRAQVNTVSQMAEFLRAVAIDEIGRGNARSVAQQLLVRRYEKLRFNFSSQSASCTRTRDGLAYYVQGTNSIEVCSNLMNHPIETLIPVFAHELAHAADPCLFDTFVVSPAIHQKSRSEIEQVLNSCGITDPARIQTAVRIANSATPYLNVDNVSASVASSCGMGQVKYQQISEADLARVPFASTHACTDKWVRSNTLQQRSQANLREIGAKLGNGNPMPALDVGVARNLRCTSESIEAFADHFGAKLTAQFLKAHAARLNQSRLQHSLYFFSKLLCNTNSAGGHGYPAAQDRITAFLQHEEIQAAVGCSGLKKKARCE